jgi:hypothetical protein
MEYENSIDFFVKLLNLANLGVEPEVLCPVCNTPLILVLSWEKAKAKNMHPGIFCPVSPSHVSKIISLRPDSPVKPPETEEQKAARSERIFRVFRGRENNVDSGQEQAQTRGDEKDRG